MFTSNKNSSKFTSFLVESKVLRLAAELLPQLLLVNALKLLQASFFFGFKHLKTLHLLIYVADVTHET